MPKSVANGFVTEPEKQVPCTYDVDVAVAGGGVAGVIAALAAARNGAQTALIDRFGSPGGNIGPGLFVGGSLTGYPSPLFHRAFSGLPREFIENHAARGGGAIPPFSQRHYLRDSSTASCVALQMLEEAGVELLLSTYAGDPIVDGNQICGLFVENKSGRQAVRAKVVIDGTGEADIARRAGAPVLYPVPQIKEKGRAMGLYYVVGGVDWNRYRAAAVAWDQEEELFGEEQGKGNRMYQDILKKAEGKGEFKSTRQVDGLATLISFRFPNHEYDCDGFASGYVAVNEPHYIDPGDGQVISRLETHMRLFCFETCQFWKSRLPGFEDSYLLTIAPFLGSRSGPAIDGEYVMSEEDFLQERRFDDVIYLYVREDRWVDVPYRVMIPRKIRGLLAVGRSASARPASLLRSRIGLMQMGQAGGIAAALAAENEADPRSLDVKKLQWKLLDAGCYLGDRTRLEELGLLRS